VDGDRQPLPDVETSSAGYAQRFAGPVGAFFLATQTRLVLQLLADHPGASVLDVGGGHGQLAGPLSEAGFAVTVLGSAPVCAERLRSLVDAGRVRFETGDLLKTPFGDKSFDVVLAFRLLPHVVAWRALVAELCRVARRAVIVDYATAKSVNALAGAGFEAKRSVEGNTRPFLVLGDGDVADAFATAGFAVSAAERQFFWPMALHRALGSAGLSRTLEAAAGALGLTRALGSPVILHAEPRG